MPAVAVPPGVDRVTLELQLETPDFVALFRDVEGVRHQPDRVARRSRDRARTRRAAHRIGRRAGESVEVAGVCAGADRLRRRQATAARSSAPTCFRSCGGRKGPAAIGQPSVSHQVSPRTAIDEWFDNVFAYSPPRRWPWRFCRSVRSPRARARFHFRWPSADDPYRGVRRLRARGRSPRAPGLRGRRAAVRPRHRAARSPLWPRARLSGDRPLAPRGGVSAQRPTHQSGSADPAGLRHHRENPRRRHAVVRAVPRHAGHHFARRPAIIRRPRKSISAPSPSWSASTRPAPRNIASLLNNLGMIAAQRKDAARAEELFRRALALDEELDGPDSV